MRKFKFMKYEGMDKYPLQEANAHFGQYRFNFSVGSIPDNYISEHTFSIEVILSELAFGQEILSINDRSAEILAQVLTFLVEHVKTVKGNPSFIEKKISFGADNINILPETKTDIDKPPIFEIPQ